MMISESVACLPVWGCRDEIIAAVRGSQVVVVAGDTGSGKSTLLPLFCREAGYGTRRRIAVTQPRRIAAVSLAQYAASLVGTPVGATVGYSIRYRRQMSENTRIVYMTDGMLLASLAEDPRMDRYDVLIIDEAHERSITIDFLLGYLRTLLPKRFDLRVIIASATIDIALFSRTFGHASVITVTGRRYPIAIDYRPVIELWKGYGIDSYIEGVIVAVEEIVQSREPGDILVFLPTIDNVHEAVSRLSRRIREDTAVVLPLHSRLPTGRQQEVFGAFGKRKVVVATNIAETSLTVPGIRFVIDSGLVRMRRYEPAASLTRMPIEKTSRASADQRAGRCGRTEDGVCIRLYTESDYNGRPRHTLPEIKRANLSEVILRMLALGLGVHGTFPFVQRPSREAVAEGHRQLQVLGAIDAEHHITPLGRDMARFPLDPPVARMLLSAKRFRVLAEMQVVSAALSVRDPCASSPDRPEGIPPEFRHHRSDFMGYLNMWKRLHVLPRKGKHVSGARLRRFCEIYGFQPVKLREWMDAHAHIRRICRRIKGFTADEPGNPPFDAVHKSLLSGLIYGIAKRKGKGEYESIASETVRIASSSVTAGKEFPWLLFHEIVATERIYGARAAAVDPKWVEELFGEQCKYYYKDPWYDESAGMVRVREEVRFHVLTLLRNRTVACHEVDRELAVDVFIREALVQEKVGERYRFIRHNRDLREKIICTERKLRKHWYAGDNALEEFYREAAPVATRTELDHLIRNRGNDAFLFVTEGHLLDGQLPQDIEEYADEIIVAAFRLPVEWRHDETSDLDGATVTVPEKLANELPGWYWEWQLPVLCRKRLELLISRVTGELLKRDIDPADAVDEVLKNLPFPAGPWIEHVKGTIRSLYGVELTFDEVGLKRLPRHFWLNVRVIDERKIISSLFRPPVSGRCAVQGTRVKELGTIGEELEQTPFTEWEGARFLQAVPCASKGQKVPVALYPALAAEGRRTAVRVFTDESAAYASHAGALRAMLEERLAEQFAWETERLKIPEVNRQRVKKAGIAADPESAVGLQLVRYCSELPGELPVTLKSFENYIAGGAERVGKGAPLLLDLIVQSAQAVERCAGYFGKRLRNCPEKLRRRLEKELERYRAAFENEAYPLASLLLLPDSITALQYGSAVAFSDPVKYRATMKVVDECRQLIDAAKGVGEFRIKNTRERLLSAIEHYLIGQFTGGTPWKGATVTADILYEVKDKMERYLQQSA